MQKAPDSADGAIHRTKPCFLPKSEQYLTSVNHAAFDPAYPPCQRKCNRDKSSLERAD
jgi:hypothetical protein